MLLSPSRHFGTVNHKMTATLVLFEMQLFSWEISSGWFAYDRYAVERNERSLAIAVNKVPFPGCVKTMNV